MRKKPRPTGKRLFPKKPRPADRPLFPHAPGSEQPMTDQDVAEMESDLAAACRRIGVPVMTLDDMSEIGRQRLSGDVDPQSWRNVERLLAELGKAVDRASES